jgi:hypothetical protein
MHAKQSLQWTKAKIAGLVLGILFFLVFITTTTILIYRRRNKDSTSPPKSDPEDIATTPDPTLSGPIHEPGTVRRKTGQPQTFSDWIRASNNEATSVQNAHYPSLEHGPGPVINSAASSTYARSNVTRTISIAPGARSAAKGSMDASSFRKAVLGAAEADEGIEVTARKHSIAQDPKIATKNSEEKCAVRGYSGAWP